MNGEEGLSRRPRGPSLFASVVVSALTSSALFFGLRALDRSGAFEDKVVVQAPGPTVVPNVVGMTGDQARELLQGRGFLLALHAQRADARVPSGAVIEQAPLAGSQIESGATVRAVISLGPIVVPELAGLDAAEAGRKLAALGLTSAGKREQASESVAAGKVIGSEPPSGSALGADAAVGLVISTGVASRAVPQVVGQRLPQATKLLQDAGLLLGTTKYGYSDYRDDGVIIKQTPVPGGQVPAGTKIDIVVNRVDE